MVEEEAIGTLSLLKRAVSCFGKAKPFNLLTLIRDCHRVRYTKTVGQLVTITYLSYSQIQDLKQTDLSQQTRIRKRRQKSVG